MSIKWMSWVGDESPYKGTQLLIHLWIADFANDDGVCWPSQTTVAKKSRCSDRYVRVTMKDMEVKGLLQITARPGTSNIYTLTKVPSVGGIQSSGVSGTPDPIPPELPTQENHQLTTSEPPVLTHSDKSSQIDEHETEELEYTGGNIEDDWADEDSGRKKPKWKTPTAEMMKYMAPFGRKWFSDGDRGRKERSKCKKLISLLQTDMITAEWVENVLSWATKPNPNVPHGTIWSFSGFLSKVIDVEKYRDWQIRYTNAQRDGDNATYDPTDLGQLRDRYEEN